MGRLATRARITRVTETGCRSGPDTVVVGEPLEIRVNGSPLAVTMHTPGSDIELTQGFLFTENIIRDRADIASIRYCNSVDADGSNTYNVLDVELAPLRRPGGPDDPVTFGCLAFGGLWHPVGVDDRAEGRHIGLREMQWPLTDGVGRRADAVNDSGVLGVSRAGAVARDHRHQGGRLAQMQGCGGTAARCWGAIGQ